MVRCVYDHCVILFVLFLYTVCVALEFSSVLHDTGICCKQIHEFGSVMRCCRKFVREIRGTPQQYQF